jgi:hypothetical protein
VQVPVQQPKCLGDRFGTYLGRIVAIDVAVFDVRLPAAPVSATATSARSSRRTPSAIAAAACALTTGPGGTVSSSCLTSLA